MKKTFLFSLLMTICCGLASQSFSVGQWILQKHVGFTLLYTAQDSVNSSDYVQFIEKGIQVTEEFFNAPFPKTFNVFIQPNRHSLDSTWQLALNIPGYQSECWMVASGIATRLDFLSPLAWKRESCEHSYNDTLKTQQLITHELVHVFHGQKNISPDFSKLEKLDWFVEGLASYASGQCDDEKVDRVKKAAQENDIPDYLDNLWTGENRYWFSGSMVKYIDIRFGRVKLIELLPLGSKAEILSALGISESELMLDWKNYILQL